jgi:diaminopimelate epimerase
LLRESEAFDFEMFYYNSDGSEATFCGNGARCMVWFARHIGVLKEEYSFKAADGAHKARILQVKEQEAIISLSMINPKIYGTFDNSHYLNTGTYHVVKFTNDVKSTDVVTEGREIRYSTHFQPHGTNVNFVEVNHNHLLVRTYEKGVEDETLACGTGVVASAVAASLNFGGNHFKVSTPGGELEVEFAISGTEISEVMLTGPTKYVFDGIVQL